MSPARISSTAKNIRTSAAFRERRERDLAIVAMKSEPEFWQLSAVELASAYRDGTSTPEAVLHATLDRIEDINPRVNAIVTLDLEGARAAAAASTQRWRDGTPLGALDGVPVTV